MSSSARAERAVCGAGAGILRQCHVRHLCAATHLSRFLSVKHNVCISVLKWLSSRVEIFDICLKVYRPWVQFSNTRWKASRFNKFVSNAKLISAVYTQHTIGYICHNWAVIVDVIIIMIKRILLLAALSSLLLTRWTMLGLLPLVLPIFSPLYARLPVYQQWVSSGEAVNSQQETWDYNSYVFSLHFMQVHRYPFKYGSQNFQHRAEHQRLFLQETWCQC